MHVLDTDVISELRKGARADAGARAFFESASEQDPYLAVQTIGEIRRGLENVRGRGDVARAGRLEAWLDLLVEACAA